jgi:Pyruvate:ferredoxin oxidoreductase core domain II
MQFKTFGEWLRHYRLQQEISPFKMTEALGYKRVSAIYNFEYGIAPLPLTKWPAMASVLQLSMEDFLNIMEQFSPDKVTEFRLIRDSAVSSDGISTEKVGNLDDELLTLIEPTSVLMPDDHMKAYRMEDADAVLVTRETWEDSLPLAVDQFRRNHQRKIGLFNIINDIPFPSSSLVAALKETKTVFVLELENQTQPPNLLAAQLKAAFLDALTGAEGYPEIHRVPKIFSVMVEPSLEVWTAHRIGDILRYFQENGRRRRLTVKNGTTRFSSDKKALTKTAVRG